MRSHALRAAAGNTGEEEFVLTASQVNGTSGSSHSFSSVSIGPAATGRLVVVSIGADGGSSGRSVSAVTIAGIEARLANHSNGVAIAAIAWALVESGTTATIVVTHSGGTVTDCHIDVGYVITTGGYFPAIDSYTKSVNATSTTAFNDTTQVSGRSLVIFSCAMDSHLSTTAPDYNWSGLTENAVNVIDTTDDFHTTASAIVDGPSSLVWSGSDGYSVASAGIAVSIPLDYSPAVARPTSISSWNLGSTSSINEVTPNLSTWIGDNDNDTLSVSFGSLTIASAGTCVLRFYEAEYNKNDDAPSNTGDTPLWENGAIAGYTLFASLTPTPAAWNLREYTFDASNISSGTITFSVVQTRSGGTGDRTGGAIAWMEFLYPPG